MAKDVRERLFTTVSGVAIERLYTPEHIRDLDYEADLGDPGKPPYTRGIYPTMYRGRVWTIRQFSGFGTASDTNARFHYLLSQGQTGLSVAFHLPTLMGYDSDRQCRRARSANAVWPSIHWPIWKHCSRVFRSTGSALR